MTQEERLARIEKRLDDIVEALTAVASLAQKNRDDITILATQVTQLAEVVVNVIATGKQSQTDMKGLQMEVRRILDRVLEQQQEPPSDTPDDPS